MPAVPLVVSPEAAASTAMVTAPLGVPSNNAYTVNYFDSNQQVECSMVTMTTANVLFRYCILDTW